jgi:hypothetical protein
MEGGVDGQTRDGFTIEGKVYASVPMQEWDMDESQILYDYTGLGLEDFAIDPDLPPSDQYEEILRYLKNPGFVRTLLHIAYRRGNPNLKPDRIRQAVGAVNAMQAISEFINDVGDNDDAGPPALMTELEKPSENGSVESNESSGNGSTTASDAQEDQPVTTGTGRSDTSFLAQTVATWGS